MGATEYQQGESADSAGQTTTGAGREPFHRVPACPTAQGLNWSVQGDTECHFGLSSSGERGASEPEV
jgi:hypothetical protein